MTVLTEGQRTLLNTCGSEALRRARADGRLPDCVEVNARIAHRCLWENPHCYKFGKWFGAEYVKGTYRSGRVSARRVTFPDDSVRFQVVAPGGRWCDSLEMDQAIRHLRAVRRQGILVYYDEQKCREADNDYNWALSR
jgi:hypothetical protein